MASTTTPYSTCAPIWRCNYQDRLHWSGGCPNHTSQSINTTQNAQLLWIHTQSGIFRFYGQLTHYVKTECMLTAPLYQPMSPCSGSEPHPALHCTHMHKMSGMDTHQENSTACSGFFMAFWPLPKWCCPACFSSLDSDNPHLADPSILYCSSGSLLLQSLLHKSEICHERFAPTCIRPAKYRQGSGTGAN